MLAWKLTTNFDTQRYLFSKKITTDYIIETFLCHCGHIEFITTHANEDIFSRLKVNLKKYLKDFLFSHWTDTSMLLKDSVTI